MRNTFLLLALLPILSNCVDQANTTIDLSGTWKFQIDSLDQGITDKWFMSELKDLIVLPGSMTTNGKGNDVSVDTRWTGGIVDSSWYSNEKYAKYREPGNVKIPFWLQPEKYYASAAWYQKTVHIPGDWEKMHIDLFLERCHWETRVWVDDLEVGSQNSLATPHIYDLTNYLTPGSHTISMMVDNRIKELDPGINSHSIADHTQSNWNGIIGKIALEARPKIYLSDVRIDTEVHSKTLLITGEIINENKSSSKGILVLNIEKGNQESSGQKVKSVEDVEISESKTPFSIRLPLGENAKLWDEFDPNLYTAILNLKTDAGTDRKEIRFGFRAFEINGTQFTINGRPTFLRGTLECAIFPRTGYPPTDLKEWKKIFEIVKSHGLNHIRFHSWCPPEAAFVAADELGLYLQVECSSWANQSTTLGDGLPIDQYIYEESERIVRTYGNHPSFCMLAYGNEPGGKNYHQFLSEFLNYWKSRDSRRLYTGGSGWPILAENQFHVDPAPRIQAWGQELKSLINSQPPQTNFDWSGNISNQQVPVVSHEIGQWCVYPNFREIEKYDGVLKAKNFEIFRETLQEQGMGDLADSFLLASGKLQALCYKADIEAALRTPGFAGFQLLDLHDFPGQGTALVGVLDAFWEEKGYIIAEEYKRFCNATVPLVRMAKRIFYHDELFTARVEVAHFGPEEIQDAVPEWGIKNQENTTVFSGILDSKTILLGNGIVLGEIRQELSGIQKPTKLSLSVKIRDFENSWDFWVYPKNKPVGDGVFVTKSMNEAAVQILRGGGKVLWSIPESTISENLNDGIGFSSIFWNTAWTGGQKPHSLGILCNSAHPALKEFPTEFHSNWQWWDAMTFSNAIILSNFPDEIKPIVRVIDDWFTNRPQALLIEVKVGNGKLLISGIDFFNNIENRPAGKQLLHSLKLYMETEAFQPKVAMEIPELKALL
jgi:hypothetical protein